MSARNNNQNQAAQQPPFPPGGFLLWGQLQQARGAFWWSKALEEGTGRKGILIFDGTRHDFLEAGETLGMLAFLLESAMADLLEMVEPLFLQTYEREISIVRIAWKAIQAEQSQQLAKGEEDEQHDQ